jgi:hypothetical protein
LPNQDEIVRVSDDNYTALASYVRRGEIETDCEEYGEEFEGEITLCEGWYEECSPNEKFGPLSFEPVRWTRFDLKETKYLFEDEPDDE